MVLVVQTQNWVNMASGTATTAPSTATTAPSTASTMEPIVPIVAQLGAHDTPSVIQGARPVVSTEQTMQSTQGYSTLPYLSGPPYTAPLQSAAPLPYAAYTAPLPSTAPLLYAAMPAMSARPTLPMGYYGQGNQFPLMPNPNWTMLRLIQVGQPVLKGLDLKTRSLTKLKLAKHARSATTSRRSPSPMRDYPRGTCTATRPSQASPRWAEHTLATAQDLTAFKADMTSMLSDMLQSSLVNLPPSSIPDLEAKGSLCLRRLWLLCPL